MRSALLRAVSARGRAPRGPAELAPKADRECPSAPDSGLVHEWQYRPAGSNNAKAMTWPKHRSLGPIMISLAHQGPDDAFRLRFADIRAKVQGRDEVVTPQPPAQNP